MQPKELFINSVRQVRIEGHTVIPTVVLYKDGVCRVGHETIDNCEQLSDLREDFKVEIGTSTPVRLALQSDTSGTSTGRSTLGIAKDFIDSVVSRALLTIERQGFAKPSRILIAEPLSLSQDRLASILSGSLFGWS